MAISYLCWAATCFAFLCCSSRVVFLGNGALSVCAAVSRWFGVRFNFSSSEWVPDSSGVVILALIGWETLVGGLILRVILGPLGFERRLSLACLPA